MKLVGGPCKLPLEGRLSRNSAFAAHPLGVAYLSYTVFTLTSPTSQGLWEVGNTVELT